MRKFTIAICAVVISCVISVPVISQSQNLLTIINAKLLDEYNGIINKADKQSDDSIIYCGDSCFDDFEILYENIILPAILSESKNLNVGKFIYDNFMIFDPIMETYISMTRKAVDDCDGVVLSHENNHNFFLAANNNKDFKRWFSIHLSHYKNGCNVFDLFRCLKTSESKRVFFSLFQFSKIQDEEMRVRYKRNFKKIYEKDLCNFANMERLDSADVKKLKFDTKILKFIDACRNRALYILFCEPAMVDGFYYSLRLAGHYNVNLDEFFDFMKSYNFGNTMELFNNKPYKSNFIENLLYVIRLNAQDGPCKGVMRCILSSRRRSKVFRDYLLRVCDKDAIRSILPKIFIVAKIDKSSGSYSKHNQNIDTEIAKHDLELYEELFLSELFK